MLPLLAAVLALAQVMPPGPAAAAAAVAPEAPDGGRWWSPSRLQAHRDAEERLTSAIDPGRLRSWHELLASAPHVAGSPGDIEVARRIASAFRDMGLAVEEHEIWAWLPHPVSARLEAHVAEGPGWRVVPLQLEEDVLAEDPWSANEDLPPAWNAYSGSGDVLAEVVHANHATKEDFEKLASLGVDVKGRVVLARYGGNFRGYKAKYAEEAGAAALVIYTDPADSGFAKGPTWPEGGWNNASSVQRGSLLTLPYYGDPLTPGVPATRRARRLDPAAVSFPRIPVQPVGWRAAEAILSRMRGPVVPEGWQGGLPCAYRLTSAGGVKVRVAVETGAGLVRTVNVVGRLTGATEPDRWVVLGAHHDAWGYGATDPTSGTIAVLECARVFAEAAREGRRPARSILFAAWAAEEFGIIGSSEWVEDHERELAAKAVAYLNADMAATGPDLGCAASPVLEALVAEVAADVPAAGRPHESGLADWRRRSKKPGPWGIDVGDLGGGSDHVGFLCHLGIPSAAPSGSGAPGSSYHSRYDDLLWFRRTVGEDYASPLMVARMDARLLARLANAEILPLDPVRVAGVVRAKAAEAGELARAAGLQVDLARIEHASRLYEARAREIHAAILARLAEGRIDARGARAVNDELQAMDREWIAAGGLPGRPWLRSRLAAPDETSGYAAWILPGLRAALLRKDAEALRAEREAVVGILRRLEGRLEAALRHLD